MSDINNKSNSSKRWLLVVLAVIAIALITLLVVFILNTGKATPKPPISIDNLNESSVSGSTENSVDSTWETSSAESKDDQATDKVDTESTNNDTLPETTEPSKSEDSATESSAEASSEEVPLIHGSSWTSFDGYTFGNCEGTYGSIYTLEELQAMDSTKQGFGPGTKMDAANRPLGALNPQEKYAKYGAIFIGEDTKNIYLTMDEGYENGYTAQILDILKEADCKVVFFVTYPYVKQNKDLVQRMIDEGHVVGNHSVNHKSMPTLSLEDASKEITKLHNYMLEKFNYEMYLFRPPMGEFSEQTLALSQSLGYRSVLWSFAYLDYDTANQPAPEKALNKVIKAEHSGAVYLLHAVSSTNTEILTDVINTFRNDDYEVGPIPR